MARHIFYPDELYHHGIKGMKWGVRRYQNPDGSLTAKGKKRYDSISDDKLQKTLTKQVRRQRGEVHGKANQWVHGYDIGENSKKAHSKYMADLESYHKTDKYKSTMKKIKQLDRKMEMNPSDEKLSSEYEKLCKEIYNPKFDSSVTYTNNGRKYVSEYVNGYGKDQTMAYIKDLGYNDQVAKEFTERIIRSKRKVID